MQYTGRPTCGVLPGSRPSGMISMSQLAARLQSTLATWVRCLPVSAPASAPLLLPAGAATRSTRCSARV
eukprot:1195745-Prorocentrum_minimum.AAC.2